MSSPKTFRIARPQLRSPGIGREIREGGHRCPSPALANRRSHGGGPRPPLVNDRPTPAEHHTVGRGAGVESRHSGVIEVHINPRVLFRSIGRADLAANSQAAAIAFGSADASAHERDQAVQHPSGGPLGGNVLSEAMKRWRSGTLLCFFADHLPCHQAEKKTGSDSSGTKEHLSWVAHSIKQHRHS